MADKRVVWKPHPQMMCKKRHQSQLPHTSAILNHPCDVGTNGLPLLQPACHHGPLATQSLSRKWKANCDNWKPNDSVLRNFLSRITGTIDHDLFPAIPRKSSIWSQTPKSSQQKRNDSTAAVALYSPQQQKFPFAHVEYPVLSFASYQTFRNIFSIYFVEQACAGTPVAIIAEHASIQDSGGPHVQRKRGKFLFCFKIL